MIQTNIDIYSSVTIRLLLEPLPNVDPCSGHFNLLEVPLTCHAISRLLAWTHTVPSTWNVLPPSSSSPSLVFILQHLAPGPPPARRFSYCPGLVWTPYLYIPIEPFAHLYYRILLCYYELWFTCLPSLYLTIISSKEDSKHCSAFISLAPSTVWAYISAQ